KRERLRKDAYLLDSPELRRQRRERQDSTPDACPEVQSRDKRLLRPISICSGRDLCRDGDGAAAISALRTRSCWFWQILRRRVRGPGRWQLHDGGPVPHHVQTRSPFF